MSIDSGNVGAVKQQVITWADADLVTCRHVAPGERLKNLMSS